MRFPLAKNHQMLFRKRECHKHSQIHENPQINPKNTGLRKKISEKVKSVFSVKSVFNPNRSLGLAWILFFRRMDFVWLLMSNSELLRIKNKQKTPYKKQKTASSYKILH